MINKSSVKLTQLLKTYSAALKSHAFGLDQPVLRIPEPLDVWITTLSAMVPLKERVILVTSDDKKHSQSVVTRASAHFGNVAHVVSNSIDDFQKSFNSVPVDSADAVIFCDNAFSHFIADAPSVITAAHRVIKKNGVVSIWGHKQPQIIAPKAAAEAFKQFQALLDTTVPVSTIGHPTSSALEATSPVLSHSSLSLRVSSTEVAHDDVYFPFPSVAKRMFESTISMSIPETVAVLKGNEQYRELMRPVAVEGAMRLRCKGDPLDDLGNLCYNATQGAGCIAVSVKHFVITCDARSINRSKGQTMTLGGRRNAKLLSEVPKSISK